MITAVSVEQVSKSYRLGMLGASTLRDDLSRRWARARGAPDPMAMIGEETHGTPSGAPFWALRDVNFVLKEGEVLGIIGQNGAGKSTLLKILSRVTMPTSGLIRVRGRIASLLEVGTGFHPELSGRENVYLNGAILGMRKKEITEKFDEIVSFSGVEQFIDTPVKRYSSGMRVRLAFAVAAHLEPEILVVDEVLAVGDAAFQKKCLNKMQAVSREGRTVLFVSHNMSAVSALCSRAVYLKKGMLQYDGAVEEALERYLGPDASVPSGRADLREIADRLGPGQFSRLLRIETCAPGGQAKDVFSLGSPMRVRIWFEVREQVASLEVGFSILSSDAVALQTFLGHWEGLPSGYDKGTHCVECEIPAINEFPGSYVIRPWIKRHAEGVDDQIPSAIEFSVVGADVGATTEDLERYPKAGVFQRTRWTTRKAESGDLAGNT